MQLPLDLLVVEEERDTILIRTATGLSLHLIVKFLIKGTVPISPAWLAVGRGLFSITDADAVVGINAAGCLNRVNTTSSASLLPMVQEGLVSSEASYLHLEISPLISGP